MGNVKISQLSSGVVQLSKNDIIPVVQDVFTNKVSLATALSLSQLVNVSIVSGGGTYNLFMTSPYTTLIFVRMVGGGGAGGNATGGTGTCSIGSGGSSGAYCEFVAPAGPNEIHSCYVGLGARWTQGRMMRGDGSSVPTLYYVPASSTWMNIQPDNYNGTIVKAEANCGVDGQTLTAGTTKETINPADASAVTSGPGFLTLNGEPGKYGLRLSGTVGISGVGGSCLFGAGGYGITAAGTGIAGAGFGSGGGGAISFSSTEQYGGNGANGFIIIMEFGN